VRNEESSGGLLAQMPAIAVRAGVELFRADVVHCRAPQHRNQLSFISRVPRGKANHALSLRQARARSFAATAPRSAIQVPFGIHRTCRIVAGLAACSASLPRKSKHGHTWPPPRALPPSPASSCPAAVDGASAWLGCASHAGRPRRRGHRMNRRELIALLGRTATACT
jgi:hypothetical protein